MSEALNPIGQALANLQAVRSLQACEGWAWLVGDIRREMEGLTRRVMEEDLAAEERERLIVQWRAFKAVLERPGETKVGATRVLNGAGSSESRI